MSDSLLPDATFEVHDAGPVRIGPLSFAPDALGVERGRFRRARRIAYSDVTHVASGRRGLAIGTDREVLLLRRGALGGEAALRSAEQALKLRIAALPGGAEQTARMRRIDARAARRRVPLATYVFALLCLAGYGLQVSDAFVTDAASFVPELFRLGEGWRLATAHFVHAPLPFASHFGMNALCVILLGGFVERALGALRTSVVMGVSAVVSMLACAAAGYAEVVGASGVVAGLAGSLLCLELNGSRDLPVMWRVPRRLFILAILAQALLDMLVPIIAGAAHIGGFVGGYAVTHIVMAAALRDRPASRGIRLAALAVAGTFTYALIAITPLLEHDEVALERHGVRLLHIYETSPIHDNAVAWLLATSAETTALGVQVAVALAERAVEETDRMDPDILDTLAETLFVAGEIGAAIETIDEAIEITDGDRYFAEQRRRFTGERHPEDRPAAPLLPWSLRAPHAYESFPEGYDEPVCEPQIEI